MARKPYSEWTVEEKKAYEEKRRKYIEDRQAQKRAEFEKLHDELAKLKAPASVMDLLEKFRPSEGGQQTSTVLESLFGTNEPKPGQTASFLFVGVRGPNGERLNAGESVAQFVARVGDVNFKYDANSIRELAARAKLKGHEVIVDRESATVRFVK